MPIAAQPSERLHTPVPEANGDDYFWQWWHGRLRICSVLALLDVLSSLDILALHKENKGDTIHSNPARAHLFFISESQDIQDASTKGFSYAVTSSYATSYRISQR